MKPMPEDWERAVAVVAHPDDLEYGAASAVARWTAQGKHLTYLLATKGEAGIAGMAPGLTGPLRVEEERRSAAVVGVVHRALLAPGQVEAHGHDDVGAHPAEGRREVAAQPDAVLDHAVAMVEELDLGYADHRRAAPFLGHPQRPGHLWCHPGDARLALRGEQVSHVLALRRPARHRRGGSVLEVVRVRDHGDGPLPVLRHRLHG